MQASKNHPSAQTPAMGVALPLSYARLRTIFMVQKYAMITTFIGGLYLNLSILFFGDAQVLEHLFTRWVDLFLLTGMIISTVLGWWLLPHIEFRSAAARRFQYVILVYFTMLCVAHGIVIQLLGKFQEYGQFWFSLPGYGYIASAVFIVMSVFTAHLRLKEQYGDPANG
jgi:hypothetical protein